MKYLVFDIETTDAVGPGEITDLNISVVSIYDSETKKINSFGPKEFGRMWKMFESTDVIVGYNSNHFDIPILNKYYSGDLGAIKSIDIMSGIKESFGRRVKLDDVANATLGIKKSANGLQAVTWWKEGRIDKIKKYCEDDVKITADLFHFIQENGFVKLRDFSGEIIKIPINTQSWNSGSNSGVTYSMGF